MKTLAEFKRNIQIGHKIITTRFFNSIDGILVEVDIPEKMKKIRKVSYKDTTGFYLKDTDDYTIRRGSFLKYPKASGFHYDENVFIISDKFSERHYRIIR